MRLGRNKTLNSLSGTAYSAGGVGEILYSITGDLRHAVLLVSCYVNNLHIRRVGSSKGIKRYCVTVLIQ